MAKVGAALDIKSVQDGSKTPTPSDTLTKIMSQTLGDLSESVEIQPEETMEAVPQGGLPQPQVQSETSGYTPEGELMPLGERFQNFKDGVRRPEFNQWENSGQSVAPDVKVAAGNPKGPVAPAARDALFDILGRSKRTAQMMDPTDNSQPTIGVQDTNVTSTAAKAKYLELNQRIEMSMDPEEKAALEVQRAQVARSDTRENTILNTYLTKLGALKVNPTNGYAAPDQKFLATGAIATEHALDNLFLGTDDKAEAIAMGEDEEGVRYSNDLVNPSGAAQRVGKEVVKWWGAEKQVDGTPINDKLSIQELKDLGGMFLLSYAKANPNLINIVKTKKDASGEYVKDTDGTAIRFELTPEGNAVYDANRPIRDEAMGVTTDPLLHPKPGLTKAPGRERPAFRNEGAISGREKKDPAYATLDEFHESIENQNGVAHVVDDQRTRIAAAMLLPSLFAPIGTKGDAFADFFGLGASSLEVSRREKVDLDGLDENMAMDEAIKIMQAKKKEAIGDVATAIRFRGRPNYLTFAMQPLAGRTMAQQTEFNPTRKKIIRFVTRSKTPARIDSWRSRLGKNYLNIMALSFGQDQMLERGRLKDLDQNRAKYVKWGNILKESLNEVLPQEAFEMAAQAIQSGKNVPPQMVQGLMKFQERLKQDDAADLMQLLIDKGEDAPMAIDALIDFAEFDANMQAGRPHITFVNAYVDGKTNGIANQGMMLGNRKLAVQVGALRSETAQEAVEGGDIRKAMATMISKRLETTIPVISEEKYAGSPGKYRDIKRALEILGSEKVINKAISMIFPYGKELAGMKKEIEVLIPTIRTQNAELDGIMNSLNMDKDILNAAHDNVVYALFDIFGEDTFNTRGVMRAVGFMHALTDSLFSLRGPAGHRILLGDKRVENAPKTKSTVVVKGPKADESEALLLQESPTYMSSAAEKNGEAAGYVRGRANVIPTQSIDGATVVRTSTGSSWSKLKSVHPDNDPYFFQIYDAFKVDVHSYDAIVYEANKNFLDITTRDWNFVEEAQKEYHKLMKDFRRAMEANPDAEFDLKDGKFDYLYKLLDPEMVSMDGTMVPQRNVMKSFIRAAFPINPKLIYSETGARKMTPDELKRITPREIQSGYQKFVNKRSEILQAELYSAFNKGTNKPINQLSFMGGSAPKLISSKQALAVFDEIEKSIKLSERLSKLTTKTNSARASLRKEIMDNFRRTGAWVAQFWAH